MLKPLDIFTTSQNQIINAVSLFYLRVTLRFPKGSLEIIKGFVFHLENGDVKLIRFIC